MKQLFHILFLLLVLLKVQDSHAQQEPQYTMYMFNTLAVNPAYAGTRDALNINFLNRNQWIGFPGAPVTQSLLVHTPVYKNFAGGLNVTNDAIGPIRTSGAYLNFAYLLKLRKATLSFGVKGGSDVVKLDLNSLSTTQQNDPSFGTSYSARFLPNFGAGLYYYTQRFYLGLSVPRALSNKFWELKNQDMTLNSRQAMHYYAICGAVFTVSESVKFKPSFQAKMAKDSPLQLDVNGSFIFNEKLYLGAFYRLQESAGAILQFNLSDQFRAGVAWDQTISGFRKYNSGSLELTVGYDFVFKKENVKSPRYF